MAQLATVRKLLKSWFPNRLNIVVALLLLPFWLLVALGFFSMLFHNLTYVHAAHHSAGSRAATVGLEAAR